METRHAPREKLVLLPILTGYGAGFPPCKDNNRPADFVKRFKISRMNHCSFGRSPAFRRMMSGYEHKDRLLRQVRNISIHNCRGLRGLPIAIGK